MHLKQILIGYERVSGQAINFEKSGIFYSNNVSDDRLQEVCDILGIHNPLNTGKYLGLPSMVGRKCRDIFNYIKEHLWKRLQGWQGRKISRAGKEVLIKSAAQAIPTYYMTTFLISSTFLDDLQIMLNKFWWGHDSQEAKGVRWMNWEKLCVRKDMEVEASGIFIYLI